MGDRSPKSKRKNETQKQAKTDAVEAKKRQAAEVRQVPAKPGAGGKPPKRG
ncbi:hypothetical protein Hsar01_02334 [Haloferula sargassicola]|uniref:Small EDRK-rich factor-like N-terminal domain-containing protein n=1 Tax=Haloferula sargassicola TaxID=490096 RepID=A0ABP9URV1_9BACT